MLTVLTFSSCLFGQRPDVIYLRDSTKIIGQIAEAISIDRVTLTDQDGQTREFLASQVDRFLDYAESGKLYREVIVRPTAWGEDRFFVMPKKLQGPYAVFIGLQGQLWLQHPDLPGLKPIPVTQVDYSKFLNELPGFTAPVLGTGRARKRTAKSPYLLASYLNQKGFRIIPGSFRISASYGISSTSEITNDNIFRESFAQPRVDGRTTFLRFQEPTGTQTRYFNIGGGYRTFMTTDGKVDVAFGIGYSFQQLNGTGPISLFSDVVQGQASATGNAHHLLVNAAMNYFVDLNTFQGYVGLGISMESPISQQHRLDNFFTIDGVVYPSTINYEGSYSTFVFPTLELGVEYPLSYSFWLTAFVKGGLRSNAIENYTPVLTIGTAINY